jgi:WhiB family transcriptional regulator, redox-sensing transcriptional regulator
VTATLTPPRPFYEWAADVPCQTMPDVFFPDPGGHDAIRAAKRICGGCPSQLDCLRWAVEHCEMVGIWGGLTPNERIALRREGR